MSPYEAAEAAHIQAVASRVLSKIEVDQDAVELAAFAATVLQHYERGELELERMRVEVASVQLLRDDLATTHKELSHLRSLVSAIGGTLRAAVGEIDLWQ